MNESQNMKALGAKGGKSNVEKNGKKHMASIASLGGHARWKKQRELDKKVESVLG